MLFSDSGKAALNIQQVSVAAMQRSFGNGRLKCRGVDGVTRLQTLYQQGCCKIRLPGRGGGRAMEAVLINSSGGMTGGDLVEWDLEADENARLTVTTQACERVYRSLGDIARTQVRLVVGEGASLAWLPQETILFNAGSLDRHIEVDLAPGARALFVEPVIFGRAAMGERIERGALHDRWRIRQNGRLVHAEDLRLDGAISDNLASSFVTNGHEALATVLFMAGEAEGLVTSAREIIGENGGASFWNGKLLARLTAQDGYSLRKQLVPLINLLNFEASLPKVWSL